MDGGILGEKNDEWKKKYEEREREKLKGMEERMRKQVEEKRLCWVM